MNTLFEGTYGTWLRRALLAAMVLLAVLLGFKALAELQGLRYIGAGLPPANTITVSGYGEALAVPDIATFTFSVTAMRSTVEAAQTEATQSANAITAYLKEAGIAERDMQTSNYSVYPQYDYVQEACAPGIPCGGGRQVLRGYEVRQTTTIKVRDTAQAGELLSGVGSRGATEVSGLNFTFDDPDMLEVEARGEAIADAKAKADELARELGVRLVRVVSFNENGYAPMFSRTEYGMGSADAVKQSAPEFSVGENKVTSNVSVTYEIR